MRTTEEDIEALVLCELDYDPNVDTDRLFVDVVGTVVHLSGSVQEIHEKQAAEQAAKRVLQVSVVMNRIAIDD